MNEPFIVHAHKELALTTFSQRSTKKWLGHGLTSLTGSYGDY